jgi:hypothetical protein
MRDSTGDVADPPDGNKRPDNAASNGCEQARKHGELQQAIGLQDFPEKRHERL